MKTKTTLAALAAVVGLAFATPASLATPSEPAAQLGLRIGLEMTKGMKLKQRVRIVTTATVIGGIVGALSRNPVVSVMGAL